MFLKIHISVEMTKKLGACFEYFIVHISERTYVYYVGGKMFPQNVEKLAVT